MPYINSIKKNTLVFLLTIGIINTTLAVIVFLYIKHQQDEVLYYSKISKAKSEFKETKNKLDYEIEHYKLVLNTLKDSKDLHRLLEGDLSTKKYLDEDFSDFVKSNKNIFQLRFINNEGFEVIRIDKNNNTVKIAEKMQNKSYRYYFKESKKLAEGEFYISDFDLNIEKGEIEIPFKPTIRIATGVYKNDSLKGVLIINFLAKDLIKAIQNKSDFDVYFMDSKGNFLLHPYENKSWSTQRKTNYKVKDEIPNIQNLIDNEARYNKSRDKNMLYYVESIDITHNKFYIIYSIKKELYEKYLQEETNNIIKFFILIFIFSIPFVLIAAYFQSIRMEILNRLINNIPFPICLKDKNGVFLIVNNALIRLYGCKSKEELIGRKSYEFIYKDLPYTSKEKDSDVLKNEKIKFINTIKLKNNKKLYYDTRIIKMSFLGMFNKTYILGVAIDITAMKVLNEQLQQKVNEEVGKRIKTERALAQKAKLAEMGNMIDNIIHQWKQPLSVISLSAQALDMDLTYKNLTEKQKEEYLKCVIEHIDFMSETADDFRMFLSPNRVKSDFNLLKCVEKIFGLLKSRSKQLDIELQANIEKELHLYGFKNELAQVLLNLLNNSFDAFEEGLTSQNRKIEVLAYENENHIFIEVKDNAGGIEKKKINKIFKDRYTTKEKKGTGIGLTISKKIIEESFKGNIYVESINKQTTFIISLPILDEALDK